MTQPATTTKMAKQGTVVGKGDLRYIPSVDWCRLPPGQELGEVVGVATDSQDRVFLFTRTPDRVLVLNREGQFLHAWGEGQFKWPHGITIGPDNAVYCTDLDHTVRKFTPDGKLLLTLGESGRPSDTGANSVDYREIRRPAGPFNFPTNVALAADGSIYVSDGYGNARIHKFSAEGRLLASFGEPGSESGQFHVAHGIAIDRSGVIYVADRENSRIQLFTPDGQFIEQWGDVARPCEVVIDPADRVFVAELGYQAGMFPGNKPPTEDATGGRVSVFSSGGTLLARWGGGRRPCVAGDFFAPHDICIDSRGDVYVSEVNYTTGIRLGLIGPDSHTLQKFVLIDPAT